MWRIAAALVILAFAETGYAASQEAGNHKPIANEGRKSEQKQAISKNASLLFDELKAKVSKDTSQQPDTHSSEKLNIDRQLVEYTRQLADFTKWLAIVTAILAIVAVWQGLQLKRTNQHMAVTERAYVKMSHITDTQMAGITFLDHNPTVRMCEVTIKVENCGRTPARVIDIRLNLHIMDWGVPLPAVPNYGDSRVPGTPFLVPGDYLFLEHTTFPLGKREAPNPKTSNRLCLFGYVDYIDVFGRMHRAGYAREYVDRTVNNLVFIAEPGYNYDRPRKPDEGNDWDDPPQA